MQTTVVPGVAMWSRWQPDRNVFFNSYFIEAAGGNLVVDPLALEEQDAREIEERGGVAWIAVTNRDHERAARVLAERFGAKLAASEADAPLLSGPVDRRLADGDELCGAIVLVLDGLKTPGEFALFLAERETAILGDALWGEPAGALRLLADDKLLDPLRAALSLRRVAALRPRHLLVGDGAPIFGDATRALWAALDARKLPGLRRVNRDEVAARLWSSDRPDYIGETLEIDGLIGAEKLGYRITRVLPHTSSCPLHWHTAEEELFVVLSGAATLVTPHGETPLRAGDFVAFPTAPHGAHKIVNRTDEACEILMVANSCGFDVCSYPDSRKILVEARDLIVRDQPELDYFDGE
ncbi:MAG: cupin domain-containing protein [Vulcanimicrobiaceae bacterium]